MRSRPNGDDGRHAVVAGRFADRGRRVSPPDAFGNIEPDEQHFHEATGNEGASFDRTYTQREPRRGAERSGWRSAPPRRVERTPLMRLAPQRRRRFLAAGCPPLGHVFRNGKGDRQARLVEHRGESRPHRAAAAFGPGRAARRDSPGRALYEAFEVKRYFTAVFTFFIPVSLFNSGKARTRAPIRRYLRRARKSPVHMGLRHQKQARCRAPCRWHRPQLTGRYARRLSA